MSDEIITVSIDDGHFNNKGQIIGKDGHIISYLSPSYVMNGSNSSFGVMGNEDTSEFTTLDAQGNTKTFTTFERVRYGEEENMVETQSHEYLHSEANRVMVHSMLHKMGLAGKKVALITTSPIRRYFKANGEVDQQYVDKRNANLMQPVYPALEGVEPVEVVSVVQIPEAYAAFLSLLFDYRVNSGKGQLKIQQDYKSVDILLLDFGGQTLDAGVISNAQPMKADCITAEGVGMLAVNELVYDELKTYRRKIDRREIMDIIETGKFRTSRHTDNVIDVSETVGKSIRKVYENGLHNIKSKIPFGDFDMILGAGGALKNPTVARTISGLIPEIKLIDEPMYANANGGLKYLIKMMSSK